MSFEFLVVWYGGGDGCLSWAGLRCLTVVYCFVDGCSRDAGGYAGGIRLR